MSCRERDRLPETLDREQLALFVLTTMEGAVMLARSYKDIAPYDAAVTQLRDYFDRLRRDGTEWSMPRPRSAKRAPSQTQTKTSIQNEQISVEELDHVHQVFRDSARKPFLLLSEKRPS